MSEWDLVLRGGRVIDPESGLDAVRDVAIAAGRIAAVGTGLPPGPAEEDVSGQVVTAGFIDLHSHVNDVGGLRLQALDGVTTALELEAGVTPVAEAYRRAAEQGRPVNYGFSASWALARMETVAGLPAQASLGTFMARISDPAWQRAAAPAQLTALIERISGDLADGALGIGVLLGYAPAASPQEYLRVAGLAAESGVATFTHARDLAEMVPATLADGAEEIVRAAGETGAHMHYCHINSTSHRHIDRVLGLVGRAQAAGSRVTTEAYPYGSGMTGIGAAFLAPERLGERGLSPSSLTFAPTGERVASEARLRELRETDPGGLVIIDLLDESSPPDQALLMRSLTFPGSVVASDAMPLTWLSPPADPLAWPLPPTAITHPRTAGTFGRALRLLTRDVPPGMRPAGLPQVLAKCSLEPARLLEDWVPAMRRKGRLQPGRDADVVVFDPETVTDQATYADSTRPSAGIRHVLVGGVFVVRDGGIVPGARPGRPVRAEPR
ncbi:MAG TPA: amidohydrolase family protein [Streptosporangiaceae bacterium]|nr:amidohydrolase family protein [Streptosporangiaceae bacterium]